MISLSDFFRLFLYQLSYLLDLDDNTVRILCEVVNYRHRPSTYLLSFPNYLWTILFSSLTTLLSAMTMATLRLLSSLSDQLERINRTGHSSRELSVPYIIYYPSESDAAEWSERVSKPRSESIEGDLWQDEQLYRYHPELWTTRFCFGNHSLILRRAESQSKVTAMGLEFWACVSSAFFL